MQARWSKTTRNQRHSTSKDHSESMQSTRPNLRATDHQFSTSEPSCNSNNVATIIQASFGQGGERYKKSCVQELTPNRTPCASSQHSNLADHLTETIMFIICEHYGGKDVQDLARAFLFAHAVPPINQKSLAELDVQKFVTNAKLRHDINYDPDLSFRPNLDGSRGHSKRELNDRYWVALNAELLLHESIARRPLPSKCEALETCRAQFRLPNFLRTVRDILKSLTPDRDHARINEVLDVPKLMQEMEHGTFDLVGLVGWIAALVKNHCAPMRDTMVDMMADSISYGVRNGTFMRSKLVTVGLKNLLNLLEGMKLDAANYQIRSLRAILVQDTILFERHYYSDNMAILRSKIDLHAAKSWYVKEFHRSQLACAAQGPTSSLMFEVFVRAVVAQLTRESSCSNFPSTFHFDHERLCLLKAEMDDIICVEICMDLYIFLVGQLVHIASPTESERQGLHSSILAIVNHGPEEGSHRWIAHSESLSLELLRRVSQSAGQLATAHLDYLHELHLNLGLLFQTEFALHAARLEEYLLPQTLVTVSRHLYSSPLDLSNALVTRPSISSKQPGCEPPPVHLHPINVPFWDTQKTKLTSISNRVSHIILLHWRVWGTIAYTDGTKLPSPGLEGSKEETPVSATTCQ